MYIGQTSRFIDRHKEHYSKDISFPPADFNSIIVLYSQLFNKSAILDVEKQLIAYFLAEAPKKSARRILFDEDSLINRTTGDHVNEYAEMEEVASDVILPFWEKELVPRGLARTPTIKELQKSKALVKYSPIKALSDEQARISDEIIGNDKNYVICGDAGTGKTVMLTTLAARFLKEKPKAKIALVLQPNWEKTCRKIFDVFGSESRRLTVTSSTKLIKSGESFDVIIVDEAHKLSRKYPKQQPSFNSVYKIPKYKSCESHLEILQKCGKRLLLMYDVLQAIRPANITREMFRNLTFGYENRFLKTQFRIKVPNGKNYTSEDYINGIKYLLYKDTGRQYSQGTTLPIAENLSDYIVSSFEIRRYSCIPRLHKRKNFLAMGQRFCKKTALFSGAAPDRGILSYCERRATMLITAPFLQKSIVP